MEREAIASVVEELLRGQITTAEYYFSLYEELSEDREILHREIINRILSRQTYSRGKRVYMLGGAPANGKSNFIKSGMIKYPPDALKIDPDEIKLMLPEYECMVSTGEPLAAEIVHEESSIVAKQLRQAALDEDFDIILDGIANDTLEKRLSDLEILRNRGHTVRIDYVSLDTDLSLRLTELRFQASKRRVPSSFILEKNRTIAELIPQLIDKECFDELFLWDTNEESHPRLILSQKNGKLFMENLELYERFKKKADVEG
jgi:predicted ABC-type ATPase